MCRTESRAIPASDDDPAPTTVYANELCNLSVCVSDFCGYISPGHIPYSSWADWCPESKHVYFGGAWCELPPMPFETADEAELFTDGLGQYPTPDNYDLRSAP